MLPNSDIKVPYTFTTMRFTAESTLKFLNDTKLADAFCFKDYIPKELASGVTYKFQCELCSE